MELADDSLIRYIWTSAAVELGVGKAMRSEGLRYKIDGGFDCAAEKSMFRRAAKMVMSECDREGRDNPVSLRLILSLQKSVSDTRCFEKSSPFRPRTMLLRVSRFPDTVLTGFDGFIE